MKISRLCYFFIIFMTLSIAAQAQVNPTVPVIKKVKPTHFYVDWNLGLFVPTGSYAEALDPDANLKFQPGFITGFDVSYYFNNYIGVNTMMQLAVSETETYLNSGVSLSSVQFALGTGLALRYRINNYFEIFSDAGVAYSGAVSEYKPKITNVEMASSKGSVAFYGDVGVRLFMSSVYLLGKVKYLGATEGKQPIAGLPDSKMDLSGLSIVLGVGFAF